METNMIEISRVVNIGHFIIKKVQVISHSGYLKMSLLIKYQHNWLLDVLEIVKFYDSILKSPD